MSIKYDFKVPYPEDRPYKFGTWQGKYTVGDINIRGTRIWLKRCAAHSFDVSFDMNGYNDFYRQLENEEYEFPGDYFTRCHFQKGFIYNIIIEAYIAFVNKYRNALNFNNFYYYSEI